jgi:hypothetical protein
LRSSPLASSSSSLRLFWIAGSGCTRSLGSCASPPVWPDQTFLVLAGIIGWFLLFRGTFNIVESLLVKDDVEQWWLILITGILQVAIALWAVGYAGRSIAVLVVWVGAWALTEGIINIWAAFRLKSVHQHAAARSEPHVTSPTAPA